MDATWWTKVQEKVQEKIIDVSTNREGKCLDLEPWGVLAEDQSLKFRVTDEKNVATRALGTEIGSNTTIEFKIQVENIKSSSEADALLFISLGSESSFQSEGYFLKYIVPAKAHSPYYEFGESYSDIIGPRRALAFKDTQTVKIVIHGSDVYFRVVNARGEVVGMGSSLLSPKREFLWIGYSTPGGNREINVTITNFKIYDN